MLMYVKNEGIKKYELHFNGDWEMRTLVRGRIITKQQFVNEEEALEFFED